LYRASALARTGLMSAMPGGDLLLVDELALQGEFRHVPGTKLIYFGREKWNSPEQDYRAFTGKTKTNAPKGAGKRILMEKIRRLSMANVSQTQKVILLLVLASHLLKKSLFWVFKKTSQCVPARVCQTKLLEYFYWLGFSKKGLVVKNKKLFRKRVIFPVMNRTSF